MKCRQCGTEFTPLSVNQKFCSASCGAKWRYRHGADPVPSVTFRCAKCGKLVVTDGISDRRTRFCSQSCEKRWWRHPPYEHESSRTNFRSVAEYASWERRTNE